MSHIRNHINVNLGTDQHIDNRRTKVLLIKYFSDTICFTYPVDRRKSQMVYSLLQYNMVETLRSVKSGPQHCVHELLQECKKYDFGRDAMCCTSEDVRLSMEHYKVSKSLIQ